MEKVIYAYLSSLRLQNHFELFINNNEWDGRDSYKYALIAIENYILNLSTPDSSLFNKVTHYMPDADEYAFDLTFISCYCVIICHIIDSIITEKFDELEMMVDTQLDEAIYQSFILTSEIDLDNYALIKKVASEFEESTTQQGEVTKRKNIHQLLSNFQVNSNYLDNLKNLMITRYSI